MKTKLPKDSPLILAVFIWLCALPLIGLLVVPLLGWGQGLLVAAVLLVIILVVCWLLCFDTFWHVKGLTGED